MAGREELGMDMEGMAAATAAFKADMDSPENLSVEDINAAVEAPQPAPERSETEESDDPFWGSEDVYLPTETESDPVIEDEIPQEEAPAPSPEIFSYKANGEDKELDLYSDDGKAQVRKALEQYQGMQKAFSDAAQLKRDMKRLKTEKDADNKYKENWDKIEDLKHDRKRLLEFISGEKYDDLMSQEVARKNAYDLGTEEERRLIDYEERIRASEISQKQSQSRSERLAARAEAAQAAALEESTRTSMEIEYNKHVGNLNFEDKGFEVGVKEALWEKSATDLKKYYVKYGKLTKPMFEKVFADNARLWSGMQSQIDSGVDKAIENKKQVAKEKAQVASTRNFGKSATNSDIAKMHPDDIFKWFQKQGR